jgi:hypothetical protein
MSSQIEGGILDPLYFTSLLMGIANEVQTDLQLSLYSLSLFALYHPWESLQTQKTHYFPISSCLIPSQQSPSCDVCIVFGTNALHVSTLPLLLHHFLQIEEMAPRRVKREGWKLFNIRKTDSSSG